MTFATAGNVEFALRNFGKTRCLRTQQLAAENGRRRLSGPLLMAIGMRETWLRNILGGAVRDASGKWVPEPDWRRQDAGALQISKRYHADALKGMRAVKAGTWYPSIEGKTAYDEGMVPMFSDAVPFVLASMGYALDLAKQNGVKPEDRQRFVAAAHNAGTGGALMGWRAGDMDRNTAGGDYSAWVMDAIVKVEVFLLKHPNWLYDETVDGAL
jgi:hypothetical protein